MALGMVRTMWAASFFLVAGAWNMDGFAAAQEPGRELPTEAMSQPWPKDPDSASAENTVDSGDIRRENTLGPNLLKNMSSDQKAIWTGAKNLHLVDVDWLIPLGAATGVMLATDTETSKHLPSSPHRLKLSNDFSNYGIGAIAAADAGFYFLGQFEHDDHKSETGFLAGEAAADSLAVTYALKYSFGRGRPLDSRFQGNFWSGGDSFPSEHAAAAWSIASVIAHEYPGPLTTLLAYGAAAGVSAARTSAKQHFPSDVLIGSAIGWYVGRHVYRAHHDADPGGGSWETYSESADQGPERAKGSIGSPFVELDSWVYPAISRLIDLGYIRTAFLGQRPWTRLECAHLVDEAGERLRGEGPGSSEAAGIYELLAREFARDLEAAGGRGEPAGRVESVYMRALGISGQPLNDSYHFGQTLINDFGRPYEEGFNSVAGFSAYGTEGRFTLYLRGEYQQAPSAPAYSDAVQRVIANMDFNAVQPAAPVAAADQFRLLDTYVSASVADWSLSFGKQSLWWGPDYGGELMFSNNAEPIYMFRATRTTSIRLPWIFHWLGPMKTDFFFGKLSGNQFPPRPLLHGEKISIKPIPDLELGFGRLAELGGVGRALTPAAVFNSYTTLQEGVFFNTNNNPGKRTGGFEFSYRVPFLRDWLTIYTDSISPDDETPLVNPPRAAWNPGLHLARFPHCHRLEWRVEGVTTNTAVSSNGGHFVYWDHFYHDLSTNKNNLIGSWIGREGTGIQAWSTYWLGPRSSLQLGYRQAKVSRKFLPEGETLNDASLRASWWAGDFNFSGLVQYEKWLAPVLQPGPQTNWTASLEIAFWPRSWSR